MAAFAVAALLSMAAAAISATALTDVADLVMEKPRGSDPVTDIAIMAHGVAGGTVLRAKADEGALTVVVAAAAFATRRTAMGRGVVMAGGDAAD